MNIDSLLTANVRNEEIPALSVIIRTDINVITSYIKTH